MGAVAPKQTNEHGIEYCVLAPLPIHFPRFRDNKAESRTARISLLSYTNFML